MNLELTLLITTINEADNLRLLLPRLNQCFHSIGAAFEILIIDGHSTDATRTVAESYGARVLCQKEMELLNQEFLKQGIPQIGVGIGIHCGTVVAGTLGSNDRMEYTVIGDVVNTAQRVEGKAAAGTVLLTQEAYEVVRRYVEAASIGEFSLKGKAHPVPLWQVSSVKERVPQLAA